MKIPSFKLISPTFQYKTLVCAFIINDEVANFLLKFYNHDGFEWPLNIPNYEQKFKKILPFDLLHNIQLMDIWPVTVVDL
jgi:hypothetical protein